MPPELKTVQQDAVALIKEMVAIPSVSRNEGPLADFLQKKLESWFAGCVTRNGHSVIVDVKGQSAGPTLMLCTHIDTVAPATGWTRDPYAATVEGNRIYGLGANDAGASVVSMIAAARLSAPLAAGRLMLCLVAEEEAGDQGFIRLEPEVARYDAAIFGEPTNMGMAASMRGSMKMKMLSRGKACHASRPWEGRNAVDQFCTDMQTLRCIDVKDDTIWGGTTIEPTIVRGGENQNQIPDLVETTLDIRTTPKKDNDWVLAQLQKAGLETQVLFNRRRPMANDPHSRLIEAVRKGVPHVADAVFNGTCDMAFAKAPSIVMGPGQSARSHAADEYIETGEIDAAIPLYRDVIKAYLG